jgi:hypothetical protein
VAAPLTFIDQVKSLLGYTGDERDEDLQFLVDAASEMVREHTGRRFSEDRVLETRTLYPQGRRSVYVDELFSNDDIVSVTDSHGSPLQYNFRPDVRAGRAKGARLFFPSRIFDVDYLPEQHSDHFVRNMHGYSVEGELDEININATFGWGENLPPEIRYIVARTVMIWYKGELAHFASTFNAEMGTTVIPEKLPASVVGQLSDWVLDEFVAV